MGQTKEYWMIYRGPGFLDVVDFGSSPAPSLNPVSKLQRQHAERLRQREEGVGLSQIIRRLENLVLFKSFNILWVKYYSVCNISHLYYLLQ
jgi:hypothetical protein